MNHTNFVIQLPETKNNTQRILKHHLRIHQPHKKLYAFRPEEVESGGINTEPTLLTLICYGLDDYNEQQFTNTEDLFSALKNNPKDRNIWIDMQGLNTAELEKLGRHFQIHKLLIEDIQSHGQRAKTDDMDNQLFALLPALSFDSKTDLVEVSQLSLLLGPDFTVSFHNGTPLDFSRIKERIQRPESNSRKSKSDYLAYLILDKVVDDYFKVLDILSDRLENLEERVLGHPAKYLLYDLNVTGHKIMEVKRAIAPVRGLVNNFWRTENGLVEISTKRYLKDVYDHINLAIEYNDNYREMVINLQELYMDQVNTKMNEVMKILTVITALLAPFTVISGIYGMNFSRIPFSDHPYGFFISILCMLLISLFMLLYFRKRGWF